MKSNIQNKKINDETITVSRTDYEELQHQVEQLKAHLDVDGDDKDTVTILSSEYEQMQQHLDQLEKQVDMVHQVEEK